MENNQTHSKRSRNLGATDLPARRRSVDPMQAYDALPGPLRGWLAQASLPWSPVSTKRIWMRVRARGLSQERALQYLEQAEARTLARDSLSTSHHMNRQS